MGGKISGAQSFPNPESYLDVLLMLVFLLCLFSLTYCQKAPCQLPLLRTGLTRNLQSKGTGFDAYCPFLTNLKDCFVFFLWLRECQEICVLSGDYFFRDVANDVFIVQIFEFFQSYLVVLRQELTVPNTTGVREKSRPTAIRKIDFLMQNLHWILFRKALSYIFFILFEERDRQLQVDLNPLYREKLSKGRKSRCNEKFLNYNLM